MKLDLNNNKEIKKFAIKIIKAETADELKKILKDYEFWDDKKSWRYYGDNPANIGTINNQSTNPIKAIVEKITNSYDSRLLLECSKLGIDPRDRTKTPSTTKQAVEKFFYKNKNNKFNDFLSLENETAIFSTGSKERPNISIIDKGEGQTPLGVPKTLMSLPTSNKSNKDNIYFTQGTFNQGGSGAINFCSQGLSVILAKKAPEMVKETHETDSHWSITITRKHSAKKEGVKEPYYTYLAPNTKTQDQDKKKLGVISFEADELDLWPERMTPYKKAFKYGVLIKLMEYELKRSSTIVTDFMYQTEIMMPDAVMPCRIHECREAYQDKKDKEFREQTTTLQGFNFRNSKSNIKAMEDGFPIESEIDFKGYEFKIKIFAFNRDFEKKTTFAKNRRMDREGLIFMLGGQHYADEKYTFFTRGSLGYSRIKDDLIVLVDCTGIDGDLKSELFKSDKSTIYHRKTSNELLDVIIDYLANVDKLRELSNKRKAQFVENKLSDEKPFENTLKQIIQKSPSLANLLKIGNRLSNPFFKETTGIKEVEKKDLKFYPTYFDFKKKLEKDEIYKRDGNINKRLRFDLVTDAVDDYFSREESNGKLDIAVSIKANGSAERFIEQENLIYSKYQNNGHLLFSLKIPEEVKVGDVILLKIKISDDEPTRKNPWVLSSEINILSAAMPKKHENPRKKKKEDKGNKQKPTGFTLPNVQWVERKDWTNHGFDDHSAMKADYGGKKTQGSDKKEYEEWDFYLNQDNIHLQNELKVTAANDKLDPKILKERYKIAMVFFALSVIDFNQKQNKEKDYETERVSENIKYMSSSISSVILPVIESLGDEDELSMIDSER